MNLWCRLLWKEHYEISGKIFLSAEPGLGAGQNSCQTAGHYLAQLWPRDWLLVHFCARDL